LGVMALTFTFTLLPFVVLAVASVRMAAGDASGWTLLAFVLTGGAILALFVTMRRLFVLSGGCAWLLVFYPLAVVLVMVFQAGAIVRALGLRGVTWRGTTYKGGKVLPPAGGV